MKALLLAILYKNNTFIATLLPRYPGRAIPTYKVVTVTK